MEHNWRLFNRNDNNDIQLVEKLTRESGSVSCKKESAYIRRLIWQTKDLPEKLLCEIVDDCAFYMMTLTKCHARGAFTIVHKDKHGQGYGKLLNQRRFARMKQLGLYKFKFRTNMTEEAQYFWLKQGAKIMDVKGNDYEMEINIK